MDSSPNARLLSGKLRTFEKNFVERFVLRNFQPLESFGEDGSLRDPSAVEATADYQQQF